MSASLGSLCRFLNGGTPDKSVSRYFDGDIPWITSADITNSVANSARTFITEEAITNSATNKIPKNAILLVTRTGVGKVAIAGRELCISQDITALLPNNDRVETDYLVHFLRTQKEHFLSRARGATIKGITRDVVAEVIVPLPSLEEQRRIAAILDQADALRAKRREALAELDGLAQAIFVEMFGDPIFNPKNLPLSRLSDVGSLDRGVSKHRPRNAPELLGGSYPLIQTGDVANCDGYIREHKSTYSEFGLRQSKLWPKGTLCITIAANIAKTGILMFDACFPDSVVGFSSKNSATIEFVRVWLTFLQKSLEDAAPESAQKNINLAILRDLRIPEPALEIQQIFAARIQALESLKVTHRTALTELDALFASLQHRAFRGEL